MRKDLVVQNLDYLLEYIFFLLYLQFFCILLVHVTYFTIVQRQTVLNDCFIPYLYIYTHIEMKTLINIQQLPIVTII